ncbi:MAG: hypothetical protein V3T23_10175, partial [Nitrososphaerales archaeon]
MTGGGQSLHHDLAFIGEASVQGVESIPTDENSITGRWPRMVNLDEATETRLSLWIKDEIIAFNIERGPLLQDWILWQNQYWAEPDSPVKNFPFRKSANIVIPLSAIAVEAIHARLMNTLFSVEPFWSIRAKSKEWIDAAKPMEQYLQTEVENSETLLVYEFCNEALLELTKLGTCIGKTGYERYTKKSLRTVGDIEEEFFVTIRNGGTVGRVPLGNFIMRFSELDPQTAPLVGEKHEFSWGQLKQMAQDGRMDPKAVEKIKAHRIIKGQTTAYDEGVKLEKAVDELAKTEPTWTDVFEVFELWCSFDVDGDGINEEVVVDYHRETGTFLSIRYNWYDDLHRPYRIANYLNVEGIWPGIGVCKQTEQMQQEVTTMHRQRLDNATLSNMTQIVLRKGMGYNAGEPIFPGKMWFVDDPAKDIVPFKLNEIYPSSYINEESIISYYEKRTGANEAILGIPQSGTPGTATSDLTRLAEGNKRFDLVLKNVKRWLSAIGVDVVVNYQLFGNQDAHFMILGEDGIEVERVLNMPSVLVRRGAVIDLTVTDTISNRQVEQQQWLSLFQVITNYYDRVLQLAQLLG